MHLLSHGSILAALTAPALILTLACTLPGKDTLRVPRAAPFIELGLRESDTLACKADPCEKWYRLAVNTSQRVSIEVDSSVDPKSCDFAIVLFDEDFKSVTQNDAPRKRPRQLSAELIPGLYALRIQKLTGLDTPLRYRLRGIAGPLSGLAAPSKTKPEDPPASPRVVTPPPAPGSHRPTSTRPKTPKTSSNSTSPRTRPPAPSPPRPAIRPSPRQAPTIADSLPESPVRMPMTAPGTLIRSDVIEVERSGGVPVAVLIEAGTPTGVALGHRGRLLTAGQEIGRVEIVDVYTAGSRAKILGELTGAITEDCVVEVIDATE